MTSYLYTTAQGLHRLLWGLNKQLRNSCTGPSQSRKIIYVWSTMCSNLCYMHVLIALIHIKLLLSVRVDPWFELNLGRRAYVPKHVGILYIKMTSSRWINTFIVASLGFQFQFPTPSPQVEAWVKTEAWSICSHISASVILHLSNLHKCCHGNHLSVLEVWQHTHFFITEEHKKQQCMEWWFVKIGEKKKINE